MTRRVTGAFGLAAALSAVGLASTVVALGSIEQAATVDRAAVRVTTTSAPRPSGTSLRFFGTGAGDIDRVKIPLESSSRANVGAGDVTVEFWIKGRLADNPATGCTADDAAWINGHIILDRDVYGPGDRGDFGLSLLGGRIAWGASRADAGATACGATNVLDGAWHHVAVSRRAVDGQLRIWVDGRLDGEVVTSPAVGDISYRLGRSTAWPNSDPFLVLGAEKHDAGAEYPSFDGWLDDLRISSSIRHTGPFTRPTAPHSVDAATSALYRFDEPAGTTVVDQVGTSNGVLRVGGPSSGPARSADVPFGTG